MTSHHEPRDQDMIDGKVQALAEHWRAGRIIEYTMLVSLNIMFHDISEAKYQLNLIKEGAYSGQGPVYSGR